MDKLSLEAVHARSLVDGIPAESVPCSDRGLAYGDGLFETVALVNGEPRHWRRHLTRLRRGAERLRMSCPDDEVWWRDLQELLAPATAGNQGPASAVLKLILTRGSGPRGYAPTTGQPPRRILQISPWPGTAEETLARVILCHTPLARSPLLAGIKHLNRLEQVLGADEVARAGAQEGLMLDTEGDLVAGTRGNVFLLQNGGLLTPPLGLSGIQGIMREVLLEVAPTLGFPTTLQRLTLEDLERCEGVALTNSVRGLQVVETLDLPSGRRELAGAQLLALREGLRQRHLAP